MQTVGQYFKSSRELRNFTIADVEEMTKIKKEFLRNIEGGLWNKLPEYPVVLGFVKNISKALEIDESKAVALFRRDYPPQKTVTAPTQEIKREFHFSPRLTFGLGVVVIILVILGYLVLQYRSFINPPVLDVYEPTQNQVVFQRDVKVSGKTDPEVSIMVNNQPVLVSEDGSFETTLDIFEGTVEVEIIATSRSGKVSIVKRTIKPDINE